VDSIIIGSITQFGRDDKSTNIGGGRWAASRGASASVAVRKSPVHRGGADHRRMIDTSTAEILASASGKGESSRSGTGLLGAGGSGYGAGGGGLDMKSSNFGATSSAKPLPRPSATWPGSGCQAAALPTTVMQISGLVADAESRRYRDRQCRI